MERFSESKILNQGNDGSGQDFHQLVKADGVVVEREVIENDEANEENRNGKHVALIEFFRFVIAAIFADKDA